jgi:two-component system chemotaxis response regulator CheY
MMRLSSKRAVIVDDNESIRVVLRTIVRQAGLQVVGEARDGETALEVVERGQPDLVCLDVVMPGRDGIEVLADLKRRHPHVRVLMITGQSDRETVENMIRQGASGIVVKPFNAARVIDTIHRAFGVTA